MLWQNVSLRSPTVCRVAPLPCLFVDNFLFLPKLYCQFSLLPVSTMASYSFIYFITSYVQNPFHESRGKRADPPDKFGQNICVSPVNFYILNR